MVLISRKELLPDDGEKRNRAEQKSTTRTFRENGCLRLQTHLHDINRRELARIFFRFESSIRGCREKILLLSSIADRHQQMIEIHLFLVLALATLTLEFFFLFPPFTD